MASLEKLKSYLEKLINNELTEKAKIEEQKKLKEQADALYKIFEEKDYKKINFEQLEKVLYYKNNQQPQDSINKLKEALSFVDYFNIDEPQFENIKLYLDSMKTFFSQLSKGLQIKIYKSNSKAQKSLEEYEEYYSMFDEKGIIRYPEPNKLESFLKFIKESNLEKEEIHELILYFSKETIDYYEKLSKIESKKETIQTEKNSKIVKKEIEEAAKETMPKEEEKEYNEEELSVEEKNIYYTITNIIARLEEDKVAENTDLVNLLENDFELETRKKMYDSTEKDSLILSDLKRILLPNFKKHKTEINKIFSYIIPWFNNEYCKKEEPKKEKYVSKVSEFNSETLEKIKEYIEIAKTEISNIESLPVEEKSTIDTCLKLFAENKIDEINEMLSGYSNNYIEYIYLLKSLIKHYNDYNVVREEEEEYVEVFGEEYLTNLKENIQNIIKKISTKIVLINEEKEEEEKNKEQEEVETINDENYKKTNIVIFLYNDEKYYIEDDQAEILKERKETMKNVVSGLRSLMVYDHNTLIALGQGKIKHAVTPKGITDYRSELKPLRLRQSDARIIYTRLPLSEKNKETLKQEYNITDTNMEVVLVTSCKRKTNDTYKDASSRIANEIKRIRKIRKLFGDDFTPESLREAEGIIEDSNDIINQLSSNLYKKTGGRIK